MSKVIAIALKDMKLRFTGKTELLYFLILPLVFTLLLSGVLFGGGSGKIVMVVVDEDNSDLSHKLVNLLQSSETVAPSLLVRTKAQESFDKREAAALLIIPSRMEANLKAGQAVKLDFTQDPTNNNGLAVQQEVQKAIGQISRGLAVASASTREAEQIQPFTEAAQRQTYYNQSLAAAQQMFDSAPTRIVTTQPQNSAEIHNQKETQAAQASVGMLIIWVFIPLLGTSELMANERVWGTLRRLVSTPTRKPTFLMGIITGQLSYGMVQMLMLVVMGLLGGCMFPLEMFPPAVANAVKILPTTWAMIGMTQLTVYNAGLMQILPYAAILLGFAVVFFAVGVWRFRYE